MKKRKNLKLLALLLCLAALISALVITVFASGEEKEDATTAIEAAFADKKVGTMPSKRTSPPTTAWCSTR